MKRKMLLFALLFASASLLAVLLMPGCKALQQMAGQAGYGDEFQFASSMYGAIAPISEAYEVEIGRTMGARVVPMGGNLCKDEALTRYVNLVGQTVVRQQNRHKLQRHQFAVLNTDQVNAFSCPGGYFFITKGALRQMDNEAQLAGLLAHEVAHVDREHMLGDIRKANIASAFNSGLKIWGDRSEFARVMGNLSDFGVKRLFETGHSQSQEYEADKLGMQYAAAAGYDPDGLRQFLAKVEQAQKLSSTQCAVLQKTHPSLSSRISALQKATSSDNFKAGAGATLSNRFQSFKRSW